MLNCLKSNNPVDKMLNFHFHKTGLKSIFDKNNSVVRLPYHKIGLKSVFDETTRLLTEGCCISCLYLYRITCITKACILVGHSFGFKRLFSFASYNIGVTFDIVKILNPW